MAPATIGLPADIAWLHWNDHFAGAVPVEGEAAAYRLGDWVVQPALDELSLGDRRKRLPPKAMDVLVCLLRQAGEVMPARRIVEVCWPGRVVEESSVYQRISQIRRALGDDPADPRYIQHVPRRGYRLVASVSALPHPSHRVEPAESGAGDRRTSQVAVLALRDLSPDGTHAWLAEGLTEQLRRQINAWRRFTSLPGSLLHGRSVDNLPADVDYLVDGYLQIEDEHVEIGLDLVDVRARKNLWSRTFRGRMGEQLEMQRQIATQIALLLGASVSRYLAPSRPEAFEPYLRFILVSSYGSYDDTHHWLEQALDRDPDWSWGWAEFASLLWREGLIFSDADRILRARRILEACRQGPNVSTNVIFIDSWIRAFGDGDFSGAEEMLRPLAVKGLAWSYAMLMLASGLTLESEAYFRSLTEKHPYLSVGWEMLIWARLSLGDGPGAIAAGRQLYRLYPAEAVNSASLLCQALAYAAELGTAEAARADLDKRIERLKDGPQRRLTEASLARIDFVLSMRRSDAAAAHRAARRIARLGRHAEACVMLQRTGHDAEAEEELRCVKPELERFWWWAAAACLTPECEKMKIVIALRERLGFTDAWRRELATRVAGTSLG